MAMANRVTSGAEHIYESSSKDNSLNLELHAKNFSNARSYKVT